MTNKTFLKIITEFIKTNKIQLDSNVIIKDIAGDRKVGFCYRDSDGDTVLKGLLNPTDPFAMTVEQLMINIASTDNIIFANGKTEADGGIVEDSFMIDDVYIKSNVLYIEHV